jgi:hypothetical protein
MYAGNLGSFSGIWVPLKIHFYEIVNNTSQYDVSVQALLEYGDISSPEEFVSQSGEYNQYWPLLVPALARFLTISFHQSNF